MGELAARQIKEGERGHSDRGERWDTDTGRGEGGEGSSRFSVHGSRFTGHDSQFTIHGSQFRHRGEKQGREGER